MKRIRFAVYTLRYCLPGILFLLISASTKAGTIQLVSPDAALHANLTVNANDTRFIEYTIDQRKQRIIPLSTIGVRVSGINEYDYDWKILKRNSNSTNWTPVYGERKVIPDKYNEIQFLFTARKYKFFHVVVTCRLYNEGFAFSYKIVHKGNNIAIDNELSTFQFPAETAAWVSTTAQGVITQRKIDQVGENIERPLTLKLNDSLFVSVGEAGLVDFARMKFKGVGNNTIASQLFEQVSHRDSLRSPWRFIMIGKSPGDLLTKNYLLLNLNDPAQIKNTSWIVPGKTLRETTLTTAGGLRSVDFASNHGLRYIAFDAGWYGREDHDTSDATRVSLDPLRSKGPLDLQRVIQYAKDKNVGVILYVNRRALERQLDTLLPLYQSWGIKGIKFGFVQVGSQKWTTWLHEAVRKAARYNMIVDVHDEYRPTGYSRAYPNLLTQEGIRGDEESIFVEHSITTLFTRMIAGPADNTFCYFTPRVRKMGSHAAQLAKAVCIYSPLQFLYWYDRPYPGEGPAEADAVISQVPELSWFDDLPVTWDETIVIEADMEAYATIARKNKNEWWLGSLNGIRARKIELPCNFLDPDRTYDAVVYTDDPAMNSRTNVKIQYVKVNSKSVLSFDLTPRNGLAIRFKPHAVEKMASLESMIVEYQN